jgi:hypothetical protein
MSVRLLAAAVLVLGAVDLRVAALALPERLSPAPDQQPTFTARLELVVLHVMVKDRTGSYVTGLASDAFTIFEDGERQTIHFFGHEDAPATVGLIIDSSGSSVSKGSSQTKALVVVSDGGDNASTTTFAQVLQTTQVSNTVIYTVALTDPVERESNPRLLKQLADASGGEAFRPRDVTQVGDVLRHIARDIRNMYTIGYVPTSITSDDRFRRIRVEVTTPGRGGLRVRTRSGYVVAER